MLRRVLPLIFIGTSVTYTQEIRLFGEGGTEGHLTDANSSSSLNPGNILGIQRSTDSSDIVLFGDITSEDKKWKLQMKLRGSNEWQRNATSQFEVSELSFKYSVASWLDLRIGRKIERWGTGYAWNPTGVVNPRKNPADPTDRRSAFRGVDMVSADLFIKSWDVTLMAVPEIDWTGKSGRRLPSAGWAARAYRLVKGTDVAFTASGGNGLPNSQGLSLARVFGNALELHGEAAYISDSVRLLPRFGDLVPVRRPHAEVLVGGQYTFPNNINVVGEFYHTGQGLDAQEWRDFRGFAQSAETRLEQGGVGPFLTSNTAFTPLQMSKNYSFLRVFWPVYRSKIEIETIVINSLRDGSGIVRPGVRWKVARNWSVYGIYSEFVGNAQTEFGHIQIKRGVDIGIRYYFSFGDKAGK
jgi:hypothetical protein